MAGNRTLTRLSGVVSIVSLTVATENQYANNILPDGILVKKSDNVLYRTDGTRAIRDLIPVADQVLTAAEKVALSLAFATGTYLAKPGGVVVHNNNGKIDDRSLNLVASGKLNPSYLSDFISNGVVKYAVLPEDVKNSFIVVNTYSDLPNVSTENRKKLVIVTDASGDPSTTVTGNNIYYYYNNSWHSLLATSVSGSDVTYESVQSVSGVMYDHPLCLQTDSTNIHDILDALVIGEAADDEPVTPDTPDEPDTPVEEVIDSPIQSSYETFISNLNMIVNADSPDLFVQMDYSNMFNYVLRVDVTDVFDTASDISINVTDSTLNLTATLALNRAYDNANIGVAGFNYGDPMYNVTVGRNENNPVLITITDGTKTATLLYSYTDNNYFYNLIEVSAANGWSISN
jgi:hypothetical protein